MGLTVGRVLNTGGWKVSGGVGNLHDIENAKKVK
jgi:hypothetical protein